MRNSHLVVLVTGAGGFAGRHLLDHLHATTDWSVVALTRSGPAPPDSHHRRWMVGDLTRPETASHVVTAVRPDLVLHLAAATPPAPAHELLSVNVGGTAALLEALTASAPQARILIVGSDAQYGPQDAAHGPTTESAPMRPLGAYGRSKVAQESIALGYGAMTGLRVVCVRPFNYIGPGQSDRFVVGAIAHQVARAERDGVPGTVEVGRTDPRRDFTDVRDVVRAFVDAALLGRPGRAYNIGSGTSRSIQEVAERLTGAAATSLTLRSVAGRVRESDVPVTACDPSRLRSDTGWEPTIQFERTLLDTLQYWRDLLARPEAATCSAAPLRRP